MHFFNTPPGLTEDQLIGIFNIKEVPAVSVRLFPLKTERSSSGLIEFPNISQAVLAIMKCNHLPIEGKGEIVLCLSVIQKKKKRNAKRKSKRPDPIHTFCAYGQVYQMKKLHQIFATYPKKIKKKENSSRQKVLEAILYGLLAFCLLWHIKKKRKKKNTPNPPTYLHLLPTPTPPSPPLPLLHSTL